MFKTTYNSNQPNNRSSLPITLFNLIFIFFILLMFLLITPAKSQQLPGTTSAVEIGGGATDTGGTLYAGYIHYFKNNSKNKYFGRIPCPGDKSSQLQFLPNRMYGKAAVFYESGSGNNIQYTSVGLDLAFYYTLLQINESIFINAKGGATISSDRMNDNNEVNGAQTDYTKMKYGLLAGGEVEWFLLPRLAVVGGLDHRVVLNNTDPWGNIRWFASAGVRWDLVKKKRY